MRWAPSLALLASSLVACGQSIVASDAAPAQPDAADVADAPAPLDVVDAPALPDAADVTDATAATDARDATDVSDATDVAEATDAASPPVEVCNGIDDNRDGMVDNRDAHGLHGGPVLRRNDRLSRGHHRRLPRAADLRERRSSASYDCVPSLGGPLRPRRENCSGATAVCPSEVFAPVGTACGTSVAVCDAMGNCGGCAAGQSLCGGQCMAVTGACMAGVGACARSGTLSCASGGAPEVANGTRNTYARLRDGTVRAWGMNSYGQLGNGGAALSLLRPAVVGITTATRVSAYDETTCAILDDETVRCWGTNIMGELGIGTTNTLRNPPTRVSVITAAVCSATPGTPVTETCNRVDDDCDGMVDEGCP